MDGPDRRETFPEQVLEMDGLGDDEDTEALSMTGRLLRRIALYADMEEPTRLDLIRAALYRPVLKWRDKHAGRPERLQWEDRKRQMAANGARGDLYPPGRARGLAVAVRR